MLKHHFIRFIVRAHSALFVLEKMRNNAIKIINFSKISDESFQFDVNIKDSKRVKKLFLEYKVVGRVGFLAWTYNLILQKTTILAILLSSVAFLDLTSRVYLISVLGTNRKINAEIRLKLKDLGVDKGIRKPNYSTLLSYEQKLRSTFYHEVEFLELRLHGVEINVKYNARRPEIEIPQKRKALYAKKDGLIVNFIVASGEIMVKENQYVKQGELLVNDRIIINGEEVVVGAYGEVYAYTWTIIESSYQLSEFEYEVDAFSYLLLKTENMMKEGFKKTEKIIEENVLYFQVRDNIAQIKIHFTCLEDLAS